MLFFFFFTNYFAHAASVVTKPDQSLKATCETVIYAIILPANGMALATHTIQCRAITEKDSLQRAARAGALCVRAPTLEKGMRRKAQKPLPRKCHKR